MSKQFILMGDIVQSSLNNGNTLMSDFKEIVHSVNLSYKPSLLSPLTITLGDEFQGITTSLKDGIDIILDIEELLISNRRKFKIRYVLYYGEIDTPINSKIAYEMLGPGLTEARKSLGELKNDSSRFLVHTGSTEKSKKLNLALSLFQFFIDSWSYKNYPLIRVFLALKDYKKVGKTLNKDTSLMWKREQSLNLKEYYKAKNLVRLLT